MDSCNTNRHDRNTKYHRCARAAAHAETGNQNERERQFRAKLPASACSCSGDSAKRVGLVYAKMQQPPGPPFLLPTRETEALAAKAAAASSLSISR